MNTELGKTENIPAKAQGKESDKNKLYILHYFISLFDC